MVLKYLVLIELHLSVVFVMHNFLILRLILFINRYSMNSTKTGLMAYLLEIVYLVHTQVQS